MPCRSPWAVLVCALLGVACVRASELGAPRIAGMGQAGAACSRGLDALGTNPALIGRGLNNAAFTLFPAGGYVVPLSGLGRHSDARFTTADADFLLARLSAYINPRYKEYLVDALDLGTLTFRTEGTIAAIVLPLGQDHAFGIHITQHAASKYTLMDGIDSIVHDIAQSGNAFPVLLRAPVHAEGEWYNEFAASYAYAPLDSRGVTDFGFGVSVKIVQGLGHATLDGQRLSTISLGSNPIFGTSIQAAIDYEIRTANGGKFDASTLPISPFFTLFPGGVGLGVGADIGLVKSIPFGTRMLTAALSITDLGSIRWSTSPALRSVHRVDTFQTGGVFFAVDSLKHFAGVSRPTAAFSTSLPAQLHLGLALDDPAPNGWSPHLMSFEFSQGLVDAVGNSTAPRIAVGAEWRRGIWRWQSGLSFNADEHLGWSFGGGVLLFTHAQIDAAIGRLNGLWEIPQMINGVVRVSLIY